MTLKNSSRGFNLFTPLVGTALVITAIVIASGMVQNDIRISKTISASYEVSSQGMIAKLIRASAEMQIIQSTERIAYEEASKPYTCEALYICNSAIYHRLLGKDQTVVPSVYADLLGYDGLFADVINSVNMVLETTGRQYELDGDYTSLHTDFADLLSRIDPFVLGYLDDGRYYVRIDDTNINPSDFIIKFKDRGGGRMAVSIAPYAFNFTTPELLSNLTQATKNVFLDMAGGYKDDDDSVISMMQAKLANQVNESNGLALTFKKAWLKTYKGGFLHSYDGYRLRIEFEKSTGVGDSLNITFQTPSFPDTVDESFSCDYAGSDAFVCSTA